MSGTSTRVLVVYVTVEVPFEDPMFNVEFIVLLLLICSLFVMRIYMGLVLVVDSISDWVSLYGENQVFRVRQTDGQAQYAETSRQSSQVAYG